MSKKSGRNKNGILLLTIIFLIAVCQITTNFVAAQETKQEKCDKLADCMQTFYRECYNDDFLNDFSPTLVDDYTAGNSTEEIEMLKLDGFIQFLQLKPQSTGYIVVYGGRTNKYGEYDIRVERVTGYTFGTKAQDRNRIKVVHGGFREKFEFEFWTSPIKNAFPPLSPTVAPEKVKFKGKMKPFGP